MSYSACFCFFMFLKFNYNTLYQIVLSDPQLFIALNDLIACLIYPHHSSINSARVIERIKNLIAPSDATPIVAWSCLREKLNVEECYLNQLPMFPKSQGANTGSQDN